MGIFSKFMDRWQRRDEKKKEQKGGEKKKSFNPLGLLFDRAPTAGEHSYNHRYPRVKFLLGREFPRHWEMRQVRGKKLFFVARRGYCNLSGLCPSPEGARRDALKALSAR